MTTALTDIIKAEIRANGPMSVSRYMTLCMTHPEYGYYTKKDPLGTQGDFITAPEISQLFGEMIGLWFADIWMQMGAPKHVSLIECGPGRGTLMVDFLRGTQHVKGFYDALHIKFVEVNEALIQEQKRKIKHPHVSWINTLEEGFESDVPTFIIGNEFLDALPFKQFQRTESGWAERVIGLDDAGAFSWGLVPVAETPFFSAGVSSGAIFEHAALREEIVRQADRQLQASGGASIFIDYGFISGHGDTFQAVKGHKHVDVLSSCGEADLTSHVDFKALCDVVQSQSHLSTQGQFLQHLGIELRAQQLSQNATSRQKVELKKALKRLCDKDEMGALFKVMALVHAENVKLNPAGF